MDCRICFLPVQCYRVAIGLTRSLSQASNVRHTFSKTFAFSTLSNRTHSSWQSHEPHSRNLMQGQIPIGRCSVAHTLSIRTLHLTPKISVIEDPSKAKNRESSESASLEEEKNQSGNDGLDSLKKEQEDQQAAESETADVKPQSLLQRFKQTYKEYGKVLIGVHVFTSCIWATSFYYAAASGIDVISLLKWLGASDKMIAPFTVPGVGHAAVAYLIYKLATPLRYAVTIGGTRVAVNVLRRWGYLPPIPEKNKIRSLVKEGQQKMKAKYGDIRKTNED